MRDVLAVCAVVVLAVCLGVSAAYLSVDLTPPGLDLIRPPEPNVAAQIRVEERQDSLRAQASGCKYCVTLADLAQRFALHARTARSQANGLRRSMSGERTVGIQLADLQRAERSADSAEAAAAALTSWASRCRSEDFCRMPPKRAAAANCNGDAAASVSAAYELAAVVKRAANSCAAATCPQMDCEASAALRSDVVGVQRALAALAGGVAPSLQPQAVTNLPVGPSTLSAEIRRISDEAIYVAKLVPVLLEGAASASANGRLPRVTANMFDDRAVQVAQTATVMEHSADLAGGARNDLRSEAAWRLKALATSMIQLGRETATPDVGKINWRLAADHLGAALLDVARLQAILGRSGQGRSAASACKAVAPEAAQQLRQAVAMLDLCRMRSACPNRAASAAPRPTGLADMIRRGAATVADLSLVEASTAANSATPASAAQSPIDLVRAQYGVCTRESLSIEASTTGAQGPGGSGAVPGTAPSGAASSPQDLVAGSSDDAAVTADPGRADLKDASAPAIENAPVDDAAATEAPVPAEPSNFTGTILTPAGNAALVGTRNGSGGN